MATNTKLTLIQHSTPGIFVALIGFIVTLCVLAILTEF